MADDELLLYEANARTGECRYLAIERRTAVRRLLDTALESQSEQRLLASNWGLAAIARVSRDLSCCAPLQLRDVHLLERSPLAGETLQPQVLVRQACVIVRAGPIRAAIFTSRVWIFVDAGSDDDMSPIVARLSAFCARTLAEQGSLRQSEHHAASPKATGMSGQTSTPPRHPGADPEKAAGRVVLSLPLPASMEGSELAARESARHAAERATFRAQEAAAAADAAAQRARSAAASAAQLDACGGLPWELLCLEALLSAILTHYSKGVSRAEGRSGAAAGSGARMARDSVSLLAAAEDADEESNTATAPLAAHLRQESNALQRWASCQDGLCAFLAIITCRRCSCRKEHGRGQGVRPLSPVPTRIGRWRNGSGERTWRSNQAQAHGGTAGVSRLSYSARLTLLQAASSRLKALRGALASLSSAISSLVDEPATTRQLLFPTTYLALESNAALAADAALAAARAADEAAAAAASAQIAAETAEREAAHAAFARARSEGIVADQDDDDDNDDDDHSADRAVAAATAATSGPRVRLDSASPSAVVHQQLQSRRLSASVSSAMLQPLAAPLLHASERASASGCISPMGEGTGVGVGVGASDSSSATTSMTVTGESASASDVQPLSTGGAQAKAHAQGPAGSPSPSPAPAPSTASALASGGMRLPHAGASAEGSSSSFDARLGVAAQSAAASASEVKAKAGSQFHAGGGVAGWDAAELPELLLESAASHAESLSRRVAALLEELESAEGHSRLLMNVSQNHIWVVQVLLSTVSCFLACCLAVAAYLGMNLGNKDREGLADNHAIWLSVVGGTTAAALVGMLVVGGCVIFKLDVGTAARGAAAASTSGDDRLPAAASASVTASALGAAALSAR